MHVCAFWCVYVYIVACLCFLMPFCAVLCVIVAFFVVDHVVYFRAPGHRIPFNSCRCSRWGRSAGVCKSVAIIVTGWRNSFKMYIRA